MKKKFKHCHIEPIASLKDAIKYCQKEETRIMGPFTDGEEPKHGGDKRKLTLAESFKLSNQELSE